MIAEKNVPRTIKSLNLIFYLFGLFVLVVSAVLVSFFLANQTKLKQVAAAIKVAHSRHSLLSEINFYVRKYQLMATGVLVYPSIDSEMVKVKNRIKQLSNELQQVQFQVTDSIHTLNKLSGEEVQVDQVDSYSVTPTSSSSTDFKVESSRVGYDSCLFQYTSDSFQVQNSSSEAVKQAYLAPDASETAKTLFKSFEGILLNGIRGLRQGSIQTAEKILQLFFDDNRDFYYLKVLTVSCVGMSLVLLGTCLLIPNVFKVMHTTKLVLALFGMISKQDISVLFSKCLQFGDEMLSENETNKFSDNIKKAEILPPQNNNKQDDNEENHSLINHEQPNKKDLDDDFDTKTEKPNLNTRNRELINNMEAEQKTEKQPPEEIEIHKSELNPIDPEQNHQRVDEGPPSPSAKHIREDNQRQTTSKLTTKKAGDQTNPKDIKETAQE